MYTKQIRVSTIFSITILLMACASNEPKKPSGPTAEEERAIRVAFCTPLRENLSNESSTVGLTGHVVTNTKYKHQIAQFGTRGINLEYFIDGPMIPGLRYDCGKFPFAHLKKVEFVQGSKNSYYNVTLKNGKTFNTFSNIPFYQKDIGSQAYLGLAGSLNPQSMLQFLAKDSRYADLQSFNLDTSNIRTLVID